MVCFFNESIKKYTKIVPLDLQDSLTSIGLAHWIMGDGYWDKSDKTLLLCTDNFTLSEVEFLIKVLKINFNLDSSIKKRIKSNGGICWRIRFSRKNRNILNLIRLVKPHIIPSLYYKLNI